MIFRFRIIHSKCLYCHGFDLLLIQWSVAVVSVSLSNLVYHIHALGHFTKSSVSTIKVWSIFVHDEELASC